MVAWKLQDAKNKFSELITKASSEGPQTIQKHGKPTAVIISFEEFKKLSKPKTSLVEFMHQSPIAGVDLELERNSDTGRLVDLV